MAIKLPQQLNFVEYKPSMVGIPTQAVARLYDRLDAQALRTEASANKMQQVLAHQLTTAADGDKAFLQDLYNKVDNVFETAKKENNLPGHSRQIRNLVGDILKDPTYAAVMDNGKRSIDAQKRYDQLVMQYGAENVVNAGDDRENFSTIGPDGQVRQFRSNPQKRPDYLRGMDQVYKAGADIVRSEADLQKFVYDDPDSEGGFGALMAYRNTQTGRIHANDLSRQMFDAPFERLTQDQQVEVMGRLNDELYNAGLRYIRTQKTQTTDASRKKLDEAGGFQTSGIGSLTLTDGTDAADGVVMVYDDRLKNSRLDSQLRNLFAYDRTIPFYIPSNEGTLERKAETGIGSEQIKDVRLTSGVGPNGLPLAMVEYNLGGKDAKTQQGYVEIPREDLPNIIAEMQGDAMYQLTNLTNRVALGGVAKGIANIYEPNINQWMKTNPTDKPYISPNTGIRVNYKDGQYHLFDNESGKYILDRRSQQPVIISAKRSSDLREIIGLSIIGMQNV